jgi:hypothetical protein
MLARCCYPAELISNVVRLYFRFPPSLRVDGSQLVPNLTGRAIADGGMQSPAVVERRWQGYGAFGVQLISSCAAPDLVRVPLGLVAEFLVALCNPSTRIFELSRDHPVQFRGRSSILPSFCGLWHSARKELGRAETFWKRILVVLVGFVCCFSLAFTRLLDQQPLFSRTLASCSDAVYL